MVNSVGVLWSPQPLSVITGEMAVLAVFSEAAHHLHLGRHLYFSIACNFWPKVDLISICEALRYVLPARYRTNVRPQIAAGM